MDPALWEIVKEETEDEEVEAIIRLTDETAKVPGVRIVSRYGEIATCRLPRSSILEVRGNENVESLKASRLLAPEESPFEDELISESDIDDERRPPILEPTGKGVILGILDWGVDFACEAFRNRDGSSRLLSLWDQRGPARVSGANPYGYGRILTRDTINGALRTNDPYESLRYHPGDADPTRTGSHGTHVMDIAGGNGRHGGPAGIAPETDLVFVHLANKATEGLANLGDSVRILEGVDFVRKIAGGRPWVINMSVGRHGGPHDGSTLVEKALDDLLSEALGRILVQSAGNYFDKAVHATGILREGQLTSLRLRVDPADITPNEVEVWYPGTDEYSVMLVCPNGCRSSWIPLGGEGELVSNGKLFARIYHRKADPQNHDNLIDAFILVGAPAGQWLLNLRAIRTSGQPSVFHAWVERDDACGRCQSYFHPEDANSFWTTGTLANSNRAIVVGAYDGDSPDRLIAPFSSAGPTRDGRQKPDLVAPGVRVLAARSTPRGGSSNGSSLVRKSGTSMAAPHVAGCAALLLEVTGGRLWNDEIRDLIMSSADPSDVKERFGKGYLNIVKAVESASQFMRRGNPKRRFLQVPLTGSTPNKDSYSGSQFTGLRSNTDYIGHKEIENHGGQISPDNARQQKWFKGERYSEESTNRNFILISGGPGLYDDRDVEHDTSWANYVTPPLLMTDTEEKRKKFGESDEEIWWFVYKPAYESRWEDDLKKGRTSTKEIKNKGFTSYVGLVEARAKSRNWNLRWLNSADDLWKLLRTFKKPISRVWFWGHARNDLWLSLGHTSSSVAVKPEKHEIIFVSSIDKNQLLQSKFQNGDSKRIHRFVGCNTSAFAKAWADAFMVWAEGVEGKIDFKAIHESGGEPSLVGKAKRVIFSSEGIEVEPADVLQMEVVTEDSWNEEINIDYDSNPVVKRAEALLASGGKWFSEKMMLNAMLGMAGADNSAATAYTPDTLYRGLLFGLPMPRADLEVLALPEQRLDVPLRAGDLLLRVALGEQGLGHIAVLADAELIPHSELARRGVTAENGQRGYYATVVEAGVQPHRASDAFARLIADERGFLPPRQVVLRANPLSDVEAFIEEAVEEAGAFEREHPWLSVRQHVILNSALEDSIRNVRPYFEAAQHKAEVSSGVRLADDQLRVIHSYAIQLKVDATFPEYIEGAKYRTKWPADLRVHAPNEIKKEFKLFMIYWWQRTWSRLLNRDIIINPPLDAVCLEDSLRPNGKNRRGQLIRQTPHARGTSYDVSGGKDVDPQNEYEVLIKAKRDPKCLIRNLTLERKNNAVHVDIIGRTTKPVASEEMWEQIVAGAAVNPIKSESTANTGADSGSNLYWAQRLNWKDRIDEILQLVGMNLTPGDLDDLQFRTMVKNWQRVEGLQPDGIIGPLTWEKMRNALSQRSVKAPSTRKGNFFTSVIRNHPVFKSISRVADINLLEPVTRSKVLAIVAECRERGEHFAVYETFRSKERQQQLYDQGATKLKTVGVHHFGLAADIVRSVDGKPSWKGDFSILGELARKQELIWGGDWGNPGRPAKFVDAVHVQRCSLKMQKYLFAGTWYPNADYNPYRE